MEIIPAAKLAEFLQTTGPWGLSALLILVVIVLWRDSSSLRMQLSALNNTRAEEAKSLALKTSDGLSSSSATGAAQAIAIERSNVLLQQILDLVRGTPGQHEMLAKMSDRTHDRLEQVIEIVRSGINEMARGGRP